MSKLIKFVAKRHTADRDDPTRPAVVLGFIHGKTMTAAAELATDRWGCGGKNELMVLVPIDRATDREIRDAFLAEADARYGNSFGKRKRIDCGCGSINYDHPRVGMKDTDVLCQDCKRPLYEKPWTLVDMQREYEVLKGIKTE